MTFWYNLFSIDYVLSKLNATFQVNIRATGAPYMKRMHPGAFRVKY